MSEGGQDAADHHHLSRWACRGARLLGGIGYGVGSGVVDAEPKLTTMQRKERAMQLRALRPWPVAQSISEVATMTNAHAEEAH
jgi:hypothetical protein